MKILKTQINMRICSFFTFLLINVIFLQQAQAQSYSTLCDPGNITIQNIAYSVDSIGLIWWKCDSLEQGELFTTYKSNTGLGTDDSMHMERSWLDNFTCLKHYFYQQYYKGIKVEVGEFREHVNEEGVKDVVVMSNGTIIENLNMSVTPTISESIALDSALALIDADTFYWEDDSVEYYLQFAPLPNGATTYYPSGELVLCLTGDKKRIASNYKLAWKFEIQGLVPKSASTVYVDATNGSVLIHNDELHEVQGSFTHIYHGAGNIDTKKIGNKFYTIADDFIGGTIPRNIRTIDNWIGYWDEKSMADNGNSNTWGNNRWAATAAHFVVQESWAMFEQDFRRQGGTDGAGLLLKVEAKNRAGENNAYYNPIGNEILFYRLKGSSTWTFPAALDIGGHEFTHGIINFTSNLNGTKEPGAIGESFADIFGFMNERRLFPGTFDWTIGENFVSPPLRSIQDPSSVANAIFGAGPNWYWTHPNWSSLVGCSPSGANDQCFVHNNAGVGNRWFYLLSMGGVQSPTGVPRVVNGIGIDKAARIAWITMTTMINSEESYYELRKHSIAAAIMLYGMCSYEHIETCRAWSACNIGPYCDPCNYVPHHESECHYCVASSTFAPLSQSDVNSQIQSFSVFPNPSSNYVNISFGELTYGNKLNLGLTITILNLNGQIVDKITPEYNDPTYKLNVSDYLPGMYSVQISGLGYSSTQKFLKL